MRIAYLSREGVRADLATVQRARRELYRQLPRPRHVGRIQVARYLGVSSANIAVCVSKLGGRSAVISKTVIGAFGKFPGSELQPLTVANCCFSLSTQLCASGLWVHLAPREAPPPWRYASVIQSTWYGASRRSSPEISGSLRLIRSNGFWMPWLRGRFRLANRSSSVKLWSARR